MEEQFMRQEMLIGPAGQARLRRARVLLFGLGGVGGGTLEALARAGVGHLTLVDPDFVEDSNLNRQLISLHSTLGMRKVDAAKARVLDIFPDCRVETRAVFYDAETAEDFDLAAYTYVADAIDTVTSKLLLAQRCRSCGARLISCMGTGNKADPSLFRVSDVYETAGDPLARVIRRELRNRGVEHLTVVWSPEPNFVPPDGRTPGTFSFVPPVAGMVMAGKILRDILSDPD